MALSTTKKEQLNNADPNNQKVQTGTEIYNLSVQTDNLAVGVGFTLPTSDPGVAGELWANSGVVTVSAG